MTGPSEANTSPSACITPEQANEALADPGAVTFSPDYSSKSGDSIRTIGYSPSADAILTVITVQGGDTTWGANAWPSNTKDRRYYQRGE